jgi:hypothetical protein
MSLELEDRLRAMYTAVAATTKIDADAAVDRPPLVALTPPPPSTTVQRARLVALVAAAAAVLAGLVLVVNGHHDRKPTASLKERPFVVPTHVPEGYALTQWDVSTLDQVPGFPAGSASVAHLVYVGPGHARLEVFSAFDNGSAPAPGTKQIDIAAGVVGRLNAPRSCPPGHCTSTLAWVQPGGNRASIRGDAISEDDALSMARSMWWVTESMFTELTAKEGFADASVVDPWTPPGEDPSVRLVPRGSLQTTFIGWGAPGGMTSFSAWVADACSRMSTFRGGKDRTVLLRSSEPIASFVVPTEAGTSTVEAGVYPGLPNWRFATARVTAKDVQGDVPITCPKGTP